MSSLQISLAIVGGLVLAAVVAYNAWVTRRSAPRTAVERSAPEASAEQTLKPPPQRIDPVFMEPGDRVEQAADDAHGDGHDVLTDALAQEPVTLRVVVPPPEKRPGLDALIDVIAPLQPETPVSGEALLAAMPGTRRVGSKPFAVEGLNETSGEWEAPRPGQRYSSLQAGVQLANRSGALNDIEFSEFVVKTQAFADTVGATPDFPDMRAEVARARELDQFASGHDAQLSFTLRARRAAWSTGYVAQHAARLGFVAGVLPGRMVLAGQDIGQAPILSLGFDPQAAMADDADQRALREVVLSLEVTHVPRAEQAFVRMRQTATALAEVMDGVVTDDAGQPLGSDTMDRIGADLEGLYEALDSHDLSAGSPQARRLFS